MWGRLEAIGPDEVHEVEHRVFAAEAGDTEREMLDDGARGLTVNEVTIGERVLEHRDDGVGVVRGLWADVFEDERERLQTTGTDVEFRRAVLVQDGGDTRESYGWRSAT